MCVQAAGTGVTAATSSFALRAVLLGGAPDRVLNAIRRSEVKQRRLAGDAADDAIDRGGRTVREKHGSGLRAQIHHVPRPVVFLVAPGVLVLVRQLAPGVRTRELVTISRAAA